MSDLLFFFTYQVPRRWTGINPRIDLDVHVWDPEINSRRPIRMHEFIETVMHDRDED